MAKSGKLTVNQRVRDVVNLMLAGAQFCDIKAYAMEHGWNVTLRQLQRYVKQANQKFAKISGRNPQQLLGRQLMQRQMLYARTLKNGDYRTALRVLSDEAKLQGIYPSTRGTTIKAGNYQPSPAASDSPLDRRQRLVRMLKAEAEHDQLELKLMKQVTPVLVYRLADTQLPLMMLNLMALMYANEQLELSLTYLHAVYSMAMDESDSAEPVRPSEQEGDVSWELISQVYAYRFRVGEMGWELFTQRLGVDAEQLVQGNYKGCMLQIAREALAATAPTADELRTMGRAGGLPLEELVTAEDVCRKWQSQLSQVLKA